MQNLQNRLAIAMLSIASLNAPSCFGQDQGSRAEKGTSKSLSLSSEQKNERAMRQLSPIESIRLRSAESGIKEVLLKGLDRLRDNTGPLLFRLVQIDLAKLDNLTWEPGAKGNTVVAHIGDSSVVTVELFHLRAEIVTEGRPIRSFSAHQGSWKDGKLETADDLTRRYLQKDFVRNLIKDLKKNGPIQEVSILKLRESWPEWKIISDDTSAKAQFVKLLELALLKNETLTDPERETVISSAKKCIQFE